MKRPIEDIGAPSGARTIILKSRYLKEGENAIALSTAVFYVAAKREIRIRMNVWQKTPVTNLVRNSSSGIYYARLFSKGKEKWKSLRTDLLEVAKAKLRELTGQAEVVAQANAAEERGRMTVNDCAVILRERLKQGYGAKGRGTQLRKITPGTRQFREETLAALFKSWPGLAEMDARKVSQRAVEQWADKFAPAYSETVVVDAHFRPLPLISIGSGENWVAYHLIAHLALHRHFRLHDRPVPAFLFLDQPSQVYFPADEDTKDDGDPSGRPESDRAKIARMFALIFSCVKYLAPKSQVIIMDHADLRDNPDFQAAVVERWRGPGNALIPEDW